MLSKEIKFNVEITKFVLYFLSIIPQNRIKVTIQGGNYGKIIKS